MLNKHFFVALILYDVIIVLGGYMNIYVELFGLLAIITLIISYYKNTKREILNFQTMSNSFLVLQYIALGKMSGVLMALIAIIRNVVFHIFDTKKRKAPLHVLLLFLFIIIALGLISLNSPIDLIIIFATSIVSYSVWQDNIVVAKIGFLTVSISVFIYNIIVGAYISSIASVLDACFAIVALLKYYNDTKKVNESIMCNDKINYQLKLDKTIEEVVGNKKVQTLLIHSCCGPCSSYVLEYLSKYFSITIYYYNPNVDTKKEFEKRFSEQKRLINEMKFENPVTLIKGEYNSKDFYKTIKGLEKEKEGGIRCFKCYELRLKEAAKYAKENNFDYFTTTLSVSPYKNSNKLNEIGQRLENDFNIKYLYADFKKRNGYKRSIELSKEYNLYRQDYCGCVYSLKNRR